MSLPLLQELRQRKSIVAVIGLGYTGWPLALALSEYFQVRGLDNNAQRIATLSSQLDTKISSGAQGLSAPNQASPHSPPFSVGSLSLSDDVESIRGASCYIIAVPTPVDKCNAPDLQQVESSLRSVASVLRQGDLVVIESTVYPGCTELFCIPILEKLSGLKVDQDFGVGYSPERINPGDQSHALHTVTKLVSASSEKWLPAVICLYESVVSAGVFACSSIGVAEAAKITENIQRDVNIALMNQLAELYEKMQIPANEVWQAASTKWNFLPFRPGLAGGHCISVDPYYLIHRAQELSFFPTLVAEARRVNEEVKKRVLLRLQAHWQQMGRSKNQVRILIKGVAFKANVGDVRNSKIIAVAQELMRLGCQVDLSDPVADVLALEQEYGLSLVSAEGSDYDIIVVAAAHTDYVVLEEDYFCQRSRSGALIADLCGLYQHKKIIQRIYWTL